MAIIVGTLGYMKARIARELKRSNLTDEIADAISDAILAYQVERFRFSDIIPGAPPILATVTDQWIYTATDLPAIASGYGIDYILIDLGGSTDRLDRWSAVQLRLYQQQGTMKGQPMAFAYEGDSLLISPVPDRAYNLTLGMFRQVPAPQSDIETDNPWMVKAERLIRSRAKYEIAMHVTRNPTMAAAMSPMPPGQNGGAIGAAYDAYCTLKGETTRIKSRGRITPMAF